MLLLSVFLVLLAGARADDAVPFRLDFDNLEDSDLLGISCSNFTTCSTCISAYQLGCGWCSDYIDEEHPSGACLNGDDDLDDDGICSASSWTFQDPHLYGSECCFEFNDNCTACVVDHSYCQYCGNYNDTGEPRCMHAQDIEDTQEHCSIPLDKTVCCSEMSTCDECVEPTVCSFCYATGECYFGGTDNSLDAAWCDAGAGIISHCCEGQSCTECFQHTADTSHDWTGNNPPCVWCTGAGPDFNASGTCVPYIEGDTSNCDAQLVLLGRSYCGDECYMGHDSCDSCVGADIADGNCVWVSEAEFPDVNDTSLYPAATEWCVRGSLLGPADDTLHFEDWQAMKSMEYDAKTFNWGVCGMSASALLSVIIVGSVVVLAALIVLAVLLTQMHKKKIRRLVNQAAAQADMEMSEGDMDLSSPDALFDLWNDEVSWEDEFTMDSEAGRPLLD